MAGLAFFKPGFQVIGVVFLYFGCQRIGNGFCPLPISDNADLEPIHDVASVQSVTLRPVLSKAEDSKEELQSEYVAQGLLQLALKLGPVVLHPVGDTGIDDLNRTDIRPACRLPHLLGLRQIRFPFFGREAIAGLLGQLLGGKGPVLDARMHRPAKETRVLELLLSQARG